LVLIQYGLVLRVVAAPVDIGIPNGPAKDSTRGLLKAHYPKNKKTRKPEIILRKARIVIESLICKSYGMS
jgi:hypothetical protein